MQLKHWVVATCLALGVTACGIEAPDSTSDATPATESLDQSHSALVLTCDYDGCPAGTCVTRFIVDKRCPGGYRYVCEAPAPGTTCS
ncbi:hypothetical protein JGU66_05745 [Myxococcaceae bacterium JPH2]|nr:hypothetical protein [Myxococcaceae bacterium JPH2]